MEKVKKKNKTIKLKGEGWTLEAIAICTPTSDVAIQVTTSKELIPDEVAAEEQRIKRLTRKWFYSSENLDDRHFIIDISSPNYPAHTRRRKMMFILNVSVLTKETIQDGNSSFKEVFMDELEGLVEGLGLH